MNAERALRSPWQQGIIGREDAARAVGRHWPNTAFTSRSPFVIRMFQSLTIGLEDSVVADVKTFESSPAASEPVVLYYDETAPAGKSLCYRIKGVNIAGDTDYSKVLEVAARP